MTLTIHPDAYAFSTALDAGRPQLVWTRVHADLETPVSACLKLLGYDKLGFLLESVVGGEVRGRYSIIGYDPDLLWRYHGQQAEQALLQADGSFSSFTPTTGTPLDDLQSLLEASALPIPSDLPPMASGLIGYLGYETAALAESIPVTTPDTLGIPGGMLMRPRMMAIFDAIAGDIFLITTVRPDARITAEQHYYEAKQRLESAASALRQPLPAAPASSPQPLDFKPNMSRAAFYSMVEKAKDHIRAGDIFQAVLSQRFSSSFPHPALAFYRSLRHMNPSPFLFYLNFGHFQLIGSSPEILVRLRDGTVTMRPIAGTRHRGKTREEDEALATQLLDDPKEVAEHLMLLDLGRNDVGRVSAKGSVRVTERMKIERYSHVMHIVSNVEGILAEGKTSLDALMAGFPAGTVSGAPKIRAMQIINELEPVQRQFYAGCVGYFGSDGAMDTCIALRTALLKDGTLHVQSGGGVVADSTPDGEYQETVNKAKALIRAAEDTQHFLS